MRQTKTVRSFVCRLWFVQRTDLILKRDSSDGRSVGRKKVMGLMEALTEQVCFPKNRDDRMKQWRMNHEIDFD
jgi:hypothetical protein